MWLYGSGFPKSLDVSKAIDNAAGAKREIVGVKPGHEEFANRTTTGHLAGESKNEGWKRPWMDDEEARKAYHMQTAPTTTEAKQWEGWGTALKPAHEPICVARKPLIGTVAENVLTYGTGAINIDECRVDNNSRPLVVSDRRLEHNTYGPGLGGSQAIGTTNLGRWPANVIHDGSEEVLEGFPDSKGQQGDVKGTEPARRNKVFGKDEVRNPFERRKDTGSAARFFYCAKASKKERKGSSHPTVKPLELMKYLCRLVTPPGGTILDPFAGTGTTGEAAKELGFNAILIEKDENFYRDIQARLYEKPNLTTFLEE